MRRALLALAAGCLLVAAACSGDGSDGGSPASASASATGAGSPSPSSPAPSASPAGQLSHLEQAQQHLKHLIFIVQENRSFDHYFGTFPGADGIPMQNGRPAVCVPDPILGRCVPPYHTSSQLQQGGPHAQRHSRADVDGGRMDGFIRMAIDSPIHCADHRSDPSCARYLGPQGQPDVMSYMTKREIPNYWAYAKRFVLQDHLFAPADSWTLPAHLFLVSAWAAHCTDPHDPMSCSSDLSLAAEAAAQRAKEDRPLVRVDRHHLPAARAGRQLGVLRRQRHVLVRVHQRPGRAAHRGAAEPAAVVHDRATEPPAREHPAVRRLLRLGGRRDPAHRVVDHAVRRRRRAPGRRRPGLGGHAPRHPGGERGDERPRLGRDRDLHHVGRLGRLLRPRPPAPRRRQRLRDPRPRHHDQPVGEVHHDRLADPVVRRVPEADRGSLPRRPATRPGDDEPAGFASDRARGRADPREPVAGVRLHAGTAAADDPGSDDP